MANDDSTSHLGDRLMREWAMPASSGDPARQHFNLRIPGAQDAALAWAYEVVTELMGARWLLDRMHDEYFLLGADDEDDRKTNAIRLGRVLDLSLELDEARHIRNFAEWIPGLRGRSIYQAVAELRGVTHAMRASQDGWLIGPGQTGRSPEAITICSGHEVAIEVKSKTPRLIVDYKPNSIKSRLDSARGQLPPGGPAVVYLQIASPWSEDEAVCQSIYRTAERWLALNRRANAVVLLLEKYFQKADGTYSRETVSATVPSWDPRTPLPDIQGWLTP